MDYIKELKEVRRSEVSFSCSGTRDEVMAYIKERCLASELRQMSYDLFPFVTGEGVVIRRVCRN